jgi:chaperone required for assembly of F1-ATPase
MKRFWKDVAVVQREDGWQVTLDARPLRTQGGGQQVVPSAALANLLADEWRAQGEEIDPRGFPLRDLADFALDKVRAERAGVIERLLRFAETDTLCYRADPDEPLFRHQLTLWDPLLAACESTHGVRFERVSGVGHRTQPASTTAALRALLEGTDDFALAALTTLASLASSLVVALAALEPGADADALFAASNAEEDWQAELWGWDYEAERVREMRLAAFRMAAKFAGAAQQG